MRLRDHIRIANAVLMPRLCCHVMPPETPEYIKYVPLEIRQTTPSLPVPCCPPPLPKPVVLLLDEAQLILATPTEPLESRARSSSTASINSTLSRNSLVSLSGSDVLNREDNPLNSDRRSSTSSVGAQSRFRSVSEDTMSAYHEAMVECVAPLERVEV